MKTLAALLLGLLVLQSYGVYGRMQADKIAWQCTLEVGPLCYRWEESALGKLLGADRAEALEDDVAKARAAWEEAFVRRSAENEAGGFDEALERAKRMAEDGVKAVRRAADRAVGAPGEGEGGEGE